MTKSWACELLELWALAAGVRAGVAHASEIKPKRAIAGRTPVRWPKGERGCRKKSKSGLNLLFVFLVFVFGKFVPILGLFLFFFVIVIGDGIDFDGMDLDHFHFGFALGAGQNFAFLDFVFVNVNFSGAFRTPDHGDNLLEDRVRVRLRRKTPRELGRAC
jgi:hypothetical protein